MGTPFKDTIKLMYEKAKKFSGDNLLQHIGNLPIDPPSENIDWYASKNNMTLSAEVESCNGEIVEIIIYKIKKNEINT